MSRKGLSIDEKKHRLLQLFHEKKEFFQLKELERIAPKEKGITQNTVKDILLKLVDDGQVDQEKIGGSLYYWSFPNKEVNTKKRKLDELEITLEETRKKLKLSDDFERKIKEQKENADEIKKIKIEINSLTETKTKLQRELSRLSRNDPEKIDTLKKETLKIKEACNRWIDNIFTIKSWCKKKFCMEDKILNKQFGIPEDLDYIT